MSKKLRTFVVGDIHGNWRGLQQALERSPFNPKEDRLITLGDYIDGGSHIEVMPVMEYLMSLPNWIGVIGNHDQWMLDAINENWVFAEDYWFNQGGQNTLDSLGIKTAYTLLSHENLFIRAFKGDCPELCKDFLNSLKLFFVDEDNNAYLHAGWFPQHHLIEDSTSFQVDNSSDLYWNRYFWSRAGSNAYPDNPYNKVFIGHTQSKKNPRKRKNVWNLDSGAGGEGKVTIMDVSTEEYWQSDTTPELYENYTSR